MKIATDKQFKSVKITPDLNKVQVKFIEKIIMEPLPGQDDSQEYHIPHQCTPPFRPHKDLIESLKKLRRPALDFIGINLADVSKDVKEFTVLSIKIAGNMDLKQSRVTIILAKKVDKLDELVEFPIPQIIMYPNEEEKVTYWNSDKIAPIVEDIVEEVWSYLYHGKFDDSLPEAKQLKQLNLFQVRELELA